MNSIRALFAIALVVAALSACAAKPEYDYARYDGLGYYGPGGGGRD
jgi:hypothetical protein